VTEARVLCMNGNTIHKSACLLYEPKQSTSLQLFQIKQAGGVRIFQSPFLRDTALPLTAQGSVIITVV